jgi:antitoxin component of RelBE/YafQ-DinJ toxin-antitoxin module
MPKIENGKSKTYGRELRTQIISVRFSEKERSRAAEEMEKSGLTFSAFVRKRILGKRVATNEEMDVLEGLRRHGRAIKQACDESGGGYSDAMAQAIRDLSAYVRALNGKRFGIDQDNGADPR